MSSFDPNAAAPADSGVFGLPHDEHGSRVVIVPVPFARPRDRKWVMEQPEYPALRARLIDFLEVRAHKHARTPDAPVAAPA